MYVYIEFIFMFYTARNKNFQAHIHKFLCDDLYKNIFIKTLKSIWQMRWKIKQRKI